MVASYVENMYNNLCVILVCIKGRFFAHFGCLSVQVSQNSSAIFLDGTNIINVKLCMMVLVIKVYLFIPLFFIIFFMTSAIFYGHGSVIKFFTENYVIVRLS